MCVPLGVRVPQHFALHIHDFVALSLRVLRHVSAVSLTAGQRREGEGPAGPAFKMTVSTDEGSCGIRSAGYLVWVSDYRARQLATVTGAWSDRGKVTEGHAPA